MKTRACLIKAFCFAFDRKKATTIFMTLKNVMDKLTSVKKLFYMQTAAYVICILHYSTSNHSSLKYFMIVKGSYLNNVRVVHCLCKVEGTQDNCVIKSKTFE